MHFVGDNNKCLKNLEIHSLHFQDVIYFDWTTAEYVLDTRKSYGEERIIATGYFYQRLTVLVFVQNFEHLRIISWRKANRREVRQYENSQQS